MKRYPVVVISMLVLLAACGGGEVAPPAARLGDLIPAAGTLVPPFAPQTFEYTVTVDSAATTFSLTATAASLDDTVTVTPAQPVSLVTGTNTITVLVVSADGAVSNSYVVRVFRPAMDARLAALACDAGPLAPALSDGNSSYGLYVPAATASASVTALAMHPGATVSFTPAATLALAEGNNTVTIRVTAEDGTTVRDYTLTICRLGVAHASAAIGLLPYVPAGTFQRDGNSANTSYVSAFRISATEITRTQFTAVTGLPDPSSTGYSTGMDNPVQRVNRYHALLFCNRLSLLEGLTPVYAVGGSTDPGDWGDVPANNNETWNAAVVDFTADGYRLPTEMEWLWAAMGANTGGDPAAVNTTGRSLPFAGSSGVNTIGDCVWYSDNSSSTTHPAGSKDPNTLGLYDMSGNVWEWCHDRMGSWPAGPLADWRGPDVGTPRLVRGGAWSVPAFACSLATRESVNPQHVNFDVGFRVVRP